MLYTKQFTLAFYLQTLTKILGQPRRFFSELSPDTGLKQPLGFLIVSSLFFTGAGLVTDMPPQPVIIGSIFFINAMGMAFIAAGLGYMVMTMIMGRRVTFIRFFSIYALSSGVTLLASWVPLFFWITEPWKWWLIGTGMIKNCGFSLTQVVVIIGMSIATMVLFFWTVLPNIT
jgi:hypothetical protein